MLRTTVLPFLFVLGVLVFVHELGHFLLARWHGVRVLTFSLGFGPKLLRWRRGDTEYAISAIPLGGYVKMAGDASDNLYTKPGESAAAVAGGQSIAVADPDTIIQGKPDEFMSKTKWQRFQIFVAGPAMNMVLAFVIMTVVLYQGAPQPVFIEKPAVVGTVLADSAAAKAGLQAGDEIIKVSGKPVATWEQMQMEVLPRAEERLDLTVRRSGQELVLHATPEAQGKFHAGELGIIPVLRPQLAAVNHGGAAEKAGLKQDDVLVAVAGQKVTNEGAIAAIQKSAGQPLLFTIERAGQLLDVSVTPIAQGDVGKIGATISAMEIRKFDPTIWQAARMSVDRCVEGSTLIFKTLAGLLNGATSRKQLAGPIGIAQLSADAAQAGWLELFTLMAMLSLNLGILNLLPIPMLDGGHIFIMALEGAARRDFSVRVKEKLLMAGFLVIMLLMVTVIYNDLTRVEWVAKLMPWR